MQCISRVELSHAAMEYDEDLLHCIIDVPRRQAEATDDCADEVVLAPVHSLEARIRAGLCRSGVRPRRPHVPT
ncbi:MAG TPA: hypothetical protein VGK73_23305 [Polyangiaceae bacterium]